MNKFLLFTLIMLGLFALSGNVYQVSAQEDTEDEAVNQEVADDNDDETTDDDNDDETTDDDNDDEDDNKEERKF